MIKDRITIYKNKMRVQVYINDAEFMTKYFSGYNKREILNFIKEKLRFYYQVKRLNHKIIIREWN